MSTSKPHFCWTHAPETLANLQGPCPALAAPALEAHDADELLAFALQADQHAKDYLDTVDFNILEASVINLGTLSVDRSAVKKLLPSF